MNEQILQTPWFFMQNKYSHPHNLPTQYQFIKNLKHFSMTFDLVTFAWASHFTSLQVKDPKYNLLWKPLLQNSRSWNYWV
jgi:hypothetical protein